MQPLSVRPGQFSCGLLSLPQGDLPTEGSSAYLVHRHPSSGFAGQQ